MTQAQLDWLTRMFGGARPDAVAASVLDLPEFQGTFDPSYYNQLRSGWNQALAQDRGTINKSTQDLLSFLGTNYSNAYSNPNSAVLQGQQAPGMDQAAMARTMSAQGVDPSMIGDEYAARAGANQAFGNANRAMAANEDIMQRSRLGNARMQGADALNALNAVGLQGTMGVGLQEAQARQAFQQAMAERNWQTAQQEALQNWQRGNQVTDTNAQNQNAYNNEMLQTLIGLLPQLGNLTLPTNAQLGF